MKYLIGYVWISLFCAIVMYLSLIYDERSQNAGWRKSISGVFGYTFGILVCALIPFFNIGTALIMIGSWIKRLSK